MTRGPATRMHWRLSLTMTLLLVGTRPHLADADINVTGHWYLAIAQQASFSVDFVQTGTSLQIEGSFLFQEGTIDSATGAFTWGGIVSPGGPGEVCGTGFQGTVSPDGRTLTGTAGSIVTPPDCHSIFCACTGSTPLGPLYGSRSPCGNGIVDPGEACDDGNLGRNADCCSLGCSLEPAGQACADDGNLCTAHVCNGAGTCTHPPLAPATGCLEPAARRSLLNLKAAPPPDRLVWNWRPGTPTTAGGFGDPTSTTGYTLCLYDSSPAGAFLGAAMPIPAGGMCGLLPCWRTTRRGFKYSNKATTPAGAQSMVLAVVDGAPRITLQGLGPNLTLPTLPLQKDPKVAVQLRNSAGACWEADYSTAIKNTAKEFKAKSD